ncbi:gluconate 2-dehydrogenase subunit 3 family protein [Persicitalea sp.]|uniref:gluconate 2-dehydrogenase subunit 3 family protein n=1 Tax=Persicitalea sp. TaxID=3100273 RepID=UPI003592F352
MKRRDSLKALTLSSFGVAAINPQELLAERRELEKAMGAAADPILIKPGSIAEEIAYDTKLQQEKYFTDKELATLAVLSDIIIPKDGKSGSASESGVPQFIEFMVKDQPNWQTPFRGGLQWLDRESAKRFGGKVFTALNKEQQLKIVDDIAYPEKAKPEMSQGVSFFNTMRNFTATGFFSSKIGIEDIGYMGNVPNVWDGVPADVLAKYKVSYDKS